MRRQLHLGTTQNGDVFVTVEYKHDDDKDRLSITGVVGPLASGDARGSCGQIDLREYEWQSFATGWDADKVTRLAVLWDRWHLNDMRAGCEHQRAIDTTRKVEVVSYKLTSEARDIRDKTIKAAARAALHGTEFAPTPTARALALLDTWYQDLYTPPDADSPLSGCYEVAKREQKAIGWVKPSEHPDGLLCKPCDVCGYKYGSAWLYEPVPSEVIAELQALPEGDKLAPSRWRDVA